MGIEGLSGYLGVYMRTYKDRKGQKWLYTIRIEGSGVLGHRAWGLGREWDPPRTWQECDSDLATRVLIPVLFQLGSWGSLFHIPIAVFFGVSMFMMLRVRG